MDCCHYDAPAYIARHALHISLYNCNCTVVHVCLRVAPWPWWPWRTIYWRRSASTNGIALAGQERPAGQVAWPAHYIRCQATKQVVANSRQNGRQKAKAKGKTKFKDSLLHKLLPTICRFLFDERTIPYTKWTIPSRT